MQPKTIKVKTILYFKMDKYLNFMKMETISKNIMQPKTSKSKNNGCGTAPGNLV